ncbi:Enoyl-CoA hydratase 2 protein [Dioscorea alata]|uniref:Enoyl-CoA hydratase 2 protein n=1 Tax=Dioscorea alata TaxID=55571 RepID=A0ACB7WPQ8_DIOAL|nr:Enoyl-CoA hydratase 2 protein [Dioscorea alata]
MAKMTTLIDPRSFKFTDKTVFSYEESHVAQYALAIGACSKDAVDEGELKYVCRPDGQTSIEVLATFAATLPYQNKQTLKQAVEVVPGLRFDPKLVLYSQHFMEIYKPLPSECWIQNELEIASMQDKGSYTIIELQTNSRDKDSGEVLCMNRSSFLLRGATGFPKSSRPYSYSNHPPVKPVKIPNYEPDFVHKDTTIKSQALIYRQCGEYNPLYSDPKVAREAGFDRPILPGLCTLGFVVRAITKFCCKGKPTLVKRIFGEFIRSVYPGEALITEMWLTNTKVIYQTKVKRENTDKVVLSGYVILKDIR